MSDYINHGTVSGYKQHAYRKETACQPCKDAEAARKRTQRAAKKGSREAIESALEALHKSLDVVTQAIGSAEERNLGQLIKAQRDILNDITKNEQALELIDDPKEESIDPFDAFLRGITDNSGTTEDSKNK